MSKKNALRIAVLSANKPRIGVLSLFDLGLHPKSVLI